MVDIFIIKGCFFSIFPETIRENRVTPKMETEYIIGRRTIRNFVKFHTKYPLLSFDNNSNSLVIYRGTSTTALRVITAITRKLRCFLVSLRILLKEILSKKHSLGLLERNVTFVKCQSTRALWKYFLPYTCLLCFHFLVSVFSFYKKFILILRNTQITIF